jgi:quercetin dioxygenase-like cupin family protein
MLGMPQVEIKTTHYFAPGVYMRQIFIPKGVTVTGKIHKTEHLNILSQGELSVWTEDGVKRLKASTVIKSKPGIKRVGFAHEDSVWITVHHNPEGETDTDKLEEMLIAKTFEEALGSPEVKQIQGGV